MNSTRYLKPSKTSPSRRHYVRWGIGILVLLSLVFTMPILLRSNRAYVDNQLGSIERLPEAQQEKPLRTLLKASGGDQVIARRLGQWYERHHNYREASAVYAAARPALLSEAVAASREAYDYQAIVKLVPKGEKDIPSDLRRAFILAQLNLKKTDAACSNAQSLPDTERGDLEEACQLVRNSNLSAPQAYRLYSLGVPVLAAEKIEQFRSKSSTDYLLLADYYQRINHPEKVFQSLKAAFKSDQYHKETVTNITKWCDSTQADPIEACRELVREATSQSQKLLSR